MLLSLGINSNSKNIYPNPSKFQNCKPNQCSKRNKECFLLFFGVAASQCFALCRTPKNRGRKVATGQVIRGLPSPTANIVDKQSVSSLMDNRKGQLSTVQKNPKESNREKKRALATEVVRRLDKNSHFMGEKKSFSHSWLSHSIKTPSHNSPSAAGCCKSNAVSA